MTNINKTLEGYAYVEGIVIPDYSKFQSSYYPFADYKPFFGTFKSDSNFEFKQLEYPTFTSSKDINISNYDLPTRYVQVQLPVLTVTTLGLYNKTEISEIHSNFNIDSIEFSIKEKINSNSNFNESVSIYAQKYSDGIYTITNITPIKRSDFEEVNTSINISANTRLEDSDFVYYTPESESIETGTIVINLNFRTVSIYESAIKVDIKSINTFSTIKMKMLIFSADKISMPANLKNLRLIKSNTLPYSDSTIELTTIINSILALKNKNSPTNEQNQITLSPELNSFEIVYDLPVVVEPPASDR